MALLCLGSLLQYSTEPLNLILHDDGTLMADDRERLKLNLHGVSFVSRSEADELTQQQLKGYPNCFQYRHGSAHQTQHILSLKLFDVALLSHDTIAYCDSDILFLKPFCQLFNFPDSSTSALFMKDFRESYSIHFLKLLKSNEIQLPSKVNAGLIFFKKRNFDLDFVEWLLKQEEFKYIFAFTEQTCWAALGYRAHCRFWDPQQIQMIHQKAPVTQQTIAGHFTTPYRYLLRQYFARDPAHNPVEPASVSPESPTVINTIPAVDCHPISLAKEHSRIHLGGVKQKIVGKRKSF
ncbi:hypothetical protein [Egbenema bharatensis]|uniref:hypothetical protein n=1 Tax=Egbenema bharatensis TaxID=3463334 RepID=UPI003A8AF1B6